MKLWNKYLKLMKDLVSSPKMQLIHEIHSHK